MVRFDLAETAIRSREWDLLVLSPGPGRPEDFGLRRTTGSASQQKLPIFGACLGLQGLVEYMGGDSVSSINPCTADSRSYAVGFHVAASILFCISHRTPRDHE